MECPYCGQEMEDGFLFGQTYLSWDDQLPRIICKGKVVLDSALMKWKCAHVPASRCKSCGAFVIPPERMW